MNISDIKKIILEAVDCLVYVSDIESYELKYLNSSLKNTYGVTDDSQWTGKKCYEFLQGKSEPCDFCNNDKLVEGEYCTWQIHNTLLDRHYNIKDTLVTIDKRKMRLEVAHDITELANTTINLEAKLLEQNIINTCIEMLHSNVTLEVATNKVLKLICLYYHAERSYIFLNSADGRFLSNTFEWCADGIKPHIDNLQNIPVELITDWTEAFEVSGELFLNVEKDLVEGSYVYTTLSDQGVSHLLVAPLLDITGKITGFLGVDNPAEKVHRTNLIKTIAQLYGSFNQKYHYTEHLYRLSYTDSMTGVKNRYCYEEIFRSLSHTKIQNIGIVYVDINDLKVENDTVGHEAGDMLIITCSNLLKEVFDDCVYRVGGDEFIVVLKDITEDEFIRKIEHYQEIISKEEKLRVSYGYKWNDGELSINDQVVAADRMMYLQKKFFYEQNDRRGNRRFFGR